MGSSAWLEDGPEPGRTVESDGDGIASTASGWGLFIVEKASTCKAGVSVEMVLLGGSFLPSWITAQHMMGSKQSESGRPRR